ncbi:hypothetical protein H4W32_000114 [Actinophytocola algeriensis]|nr:hypothetical protein [Actinophytocola algeriensis]
MAVALIGDVDRAVAIAAENGTGSLKSGSAEVRAS